MSQMFNVGWKNLSTAILQHEKSNWYMVLIPGTISYLNMVLLTQYWLSVRHRKDTTTPQFETDCTMKFCKNLQRVIDLSNTSNPEWSPFWMNYKALKQIIMKLPSLVPDAGEESDRSKSQENPSTQRQVRRMEQRPGEVAFFQFLHSEMKKTTHFFDGIEQELQIRLARVRGGMQIWNRPTPSMITDKWSRIAKSIFRLRTDLLLIETYAIMNYCAFSKIIKKHDKVTGYNTRTAFMANVVNKANFTHYPKVLNMMRISEKMYEEVSDNLSSEGIFGLYEDERLFIDMIQELNSQVMGTAEDEGAPMTTPRRKACRDLVNIERAEMAEDSFNSSLRSIVQEYGDVVTEPATDADGAAAISEDTSRHGMNMIDCNTTSKDAKTDSKNWIE